MRPRRRSILMVTLTAGILVGCADPGASPGPSEPSSGPPIGVGRRRRPTAPPLRSGSVEPIPSDDLGDFTCDLPIVEDPTVAIANIVDVRTGSHDGYDRVVFEFEQGTPELTLDRASPPFTQDASGAPIAVDGTSFLRLSMRGGTKQTDAGTSSYDGPTDLDPGLPVLVDLVEGGDFERQSTWYLGLTSEACVRVDAARRSSAPGDRRRTALNGRARLIRRPGRRPCRRP